ncbi:ATPase family associated with various cellular activities [Prunus dulcis]|uniref:ATPase family associated with various cellular activities n=1 Tax=Prunus dulcis TaxID=3755 RepID=A0A4Y1QZ80_PRUDU|nr:ATPase family associated with various cellular activities [Prunus dulcis]
MKFRDVFGGGEHREKEVMKSSNEYNKEKPLRERVRAAARPKNEIKVMNEAQKEYAWADKYQPLCLEDFICNKDKATQLQALARGGACGHFIFEGPPGVGKRTMIWAMLREAFGRDTIHAREEFKAFNLKGEMVGSIEVHVKQSPQHVEVNLSELKGYEKHVIVELMRETQDKTTNKALPCGLDNCRAIILYEADKLSTDALLYIKWLLERYKGCNKVFFCCSDVSKLQAIKSLCTVVELLPPSKTETVAVLKFIAKQEGIDLPHELAERFAENSKNNFYLAIRSFEATWKKWFIRFSNFQLGWEDNIADIAKNMIEEQSPKQLYIIRGKLQNLVVHGVSPEFIFQDRIESMYDEYNRNDENMFESDKYDHEEMSKRLNDHSRKSIKQFLRIEGKKV